MKMFELSSKKYPNGRRKFTAILCEVHPDSCVDEVNEVGTQFNKNGITWIREYCEKALPSIQGAHLKAQFSDEERTELLGHGETGVSSDGVPLFEDAVIIGTFTNGYIQDVETKDGTKTFCFGEGELDASVYHNFSNKLDEEIANGNYPFGSVEIMHTVNEPAIVYKYGYKDEGRIPSVFDFSGFALLGVEPADDSARLTELNSKQNKEDFQTMNETEIRALIDEATKKIATEISAAETEINKCKDECASKCNEKQEALDAVIAEKEALMASAEEIKKALEEAQAELEKKYEELDQLYEEKRALEKELGKAQARERVAELTTATAEFTDEEKGYAEAEINAFNENPLEHEVNSVVNKILEGIGKKAKAEEKVLAEQNSANKSVEDIFSEVKSATTSAEDVNIF